MIKFIKIAFLAGLVICGEVFAQTATPIPDAVSQYFDANGNPLSGGNVTFFIPNTSTLAQTWQDVNKSVLNTATITLDGAGRAKIFGNGSYRQVVKDSLNNLIWDYVTNAANPGGTIIITGDGDLVGTIKPWAGFVAPNQYAFAFGQAISRTTYSVLLTAITQSITVNCTSGSPTLSGIGDTSQIPVGAAIEAACVAPGTTVLSKTSSTIVASANASSTTNLTAIFFPYGNGDGSTTFNIPDLRGYVIAGRPNMGGVTSSNLTSTYFGTNPQAIGAKGGSQSQILLTSNLPSISPTITLTDPGHAHTIGFSNQAINTPGGGGAVTSGGTITTSSNTTGITASINHIGGSGAALSAVLINGGSGYTNGAQVLTISGGTCSVQPTFNVTVAGNIVTTVNSVNVAGNCSIPPVMPASVTGGGGTGAKLDVSFTAQPLTTLQPTFTLNYIIKIAPDVSATQASGVASINGMVGAIGCGTGLLCTGNVISSINTSIQRNILTANTNFYVRADGNDANCTGLVDAAYVSGTYPQACRFATPQGASDTLHALWDGGGLFQALVQITGNYSSAGFILNVNGPFTGGSPTNATYPSAANCPVVFKSASGVATDVTLTSTGLDAVLGTNGAIFCIQDMTLAATVGSDLHAGYAGIYFSNVIFNAAGRSWIWSGHESIIENYGNFTINGNAPTGLEGSYTSSLYLSGGTTLTLNANVTVVCFATSFHGGQLSFNNMIITLGGHTVTGKKFCAVDGSSIDTGTSGNRNYLPGLTAGINDFTSSYDGDGISNGSFAAAANGTITIQSTSNASPSGDAVALQASLINLGWATLPVAVNCGATTKGCLFNVAGSTSGSQIWKPAAATSGTITWPAGTIDFSATGGTSQVVKQVSAGAAFTVGRLAASDLSDGTTGTGTIPLYGTGTWTPTLLGSGTAGTPTYAIQTGSYERNAITWRASFSVQVTSLGGATGNLLISGLPFTQANVANDYGQCFILDYIGWTGDTGYTSLTGFIQPNGNQVQLFENGSSKSGQQTPLSNYAASTLIVGLCFGHT